MIILGIEMFLYRLLPMAIRLDKDKMPLIPPHGTPCENIDDLQSAITTKGGEIKKYIMDSLLRAIRDNE